MVRNPNSDRTPCPNDNGEPFRALEVGFAWDAATNQGRTLYRCAVCEVLFNLGEYETPQYAALAEVLRQSG